MSNAAEMDAQEIINYIATAPKKTPVKLYVREKPGMKVAWGDAHVYGGRRGKTVFGDWDELKAILDANADSIDYYDVENDCRAPPCPCSTSSASTPASSRARSSVTASRSAIAPSS